MDVRELFRGAGAPEGPVAHGASSWVVTDMDSGAITRFGPHSDDRTLLATTPRPNGLAVSGDGALWVAESREPALMRIGVGESDAIVVTTTASDEPLLWPNDLCFGPDGLLYLTDSGVNIDAFEGASSRPDGPEVDGRVVVIDPETGDAEILTRGLQFANGIAIGPDQATLYVAETLTGLIHRYPLGNVAADTRETFGQVLTGPPESFGGIAGPDGMAFDADGVLLVSVLTQGTLTTLSPHGAVLDHIPLPDSFPTNLAFGGPERRTVLVTGCATGALYEIDWPTEGLPLHDGDAPRADLRRLD